MLLKDSGIEHDGFPGRPRCRPDEAVRTVDAIGETAVERSLTALTKLFTVAGSFSIMSPRTLIAVSVNGPSTLPALKIG
jgi:hypothetical protein